MKAFILGILAGALIGIAPAWAGGVTLVPRWAIEKNAANEGVGKAERLYAVELLCQIGESAMRVKTEVGGWISRQDDRKSMVLVSASWGYRAQLPVGGLFFEAFVGPAWVSSRDEHQSSHIQIKHDLGIGWADTRGWGVALGYTHMSNAGFVPPNLGRDFLGVRFLIPLGGG